MDPDQLELIRWVQQFKQRCDRKPAKSDIPAHLGTAAPLRVRPGHRTHIITPLPTASSRSLRLRKLHSQKAQEQRCHRR
jgi:hypothetical protein